ncbi:pseudouridine synthase [Neisseria sp. Ec49-e6-T10]|uniref:pseudouridine synthase n=1 Tax=Neisseria sp. Ec49-e6-T10 TaxID=3140744 RepID=UPI003EC0CAD4
MDHLIAFNKPYGMICQFSEHEKHPTLKSCIKQSGFYPAGRLDTDSEGLLLLTNNGKLQAKIADPKFKLPKTYWAQVEGIPTKKDLTPIYEGIQLKNDTYAPAKAQLLAEPEQLWPRNPPIRERKSIPVSWIEIQISEGKNRQIRHMCAHIGFPCLRLIRVSIGSLNLFDLNLAPEQYRFIDSTNLFRR